MSETVTAQLKQIIASELKDMDVTAAEIDESASLFEEGLGLDSVSLVELIASSEKHFDIEFSDAELNPDSFSNLTVLAELISSKQAQKQEVVA